MSKEEKITLESLKIYKLTFYDMSIGKDVITIYGHIGDKCVETTAIDKEEFESKPLIYERYLRPMIKCFDRIIKKDDYIYNDRKPFFTTYNELIDVKEYESEYKAVNET